MEEQTEKNKKKKKEVKPNYRVGNKKEILLLLHKIGVIPYKSLRLLTAPAYPRMIQRTVCQMEQDKVIKIEKRGNEKVIVLHCPETQGIKYRDYIPTYVKDYYLNFSGRSSWKTTSKDIVAQTKTIRDTGAQMFFYSCGFNIGPDVKNIMTKFIDGNDNSYYCSRELKNLDKYNAGTGRKISASRINGLLLSKGGAFAVYNLGNQMIEWRRFSEVKISTYITELIRKRSMYELDAKVPKEAIVMATTDRIFSQICELNYEKNKNYHITYMNVDYVYDALYAIPEDINGKLMISIMNTQDWKHQIKKMLLKPDQIENQLYTSIPCDGYDKENDVHILLFCIPDLVKLKSFIARANLEGNKKKYRIYCYNYQVPMILQLAGNNVEIMKTDINKFHNKYFAEQKIDDG